MCRPVCLSVVFAVLRESANNPEQQYHALVHCDNPAPAPCHRRPRGEVVDAVYHRYPPASTSELSRAGNPETRNRKHLRWKGQVTIKGFVMLFQGGQLEARRDL